MKQKESKNGAIRGRMEGGAANPIDVFVGNKIRTRRNFLGISQEFVALKMGITFQQVQKYEIGKNRLGASRLFDISQILGVDVNYFFEGMPENIMQLSPRQILEQPVEIEGMTYNADYFFRKDVSLMLQYFQKINDPTIRQKAVLDLQFLTTIQSKEPF